MTVSPATRPAALVRRHPIESAVVLLALVAALWLSIRVGTLGWHPMGDYRTLQLRVSDVGGSQTPLVGLYSRFGWNHPGPWVYWLLAGPARLFGDDGLLVGAVMVNLAAVAAIDRACGPLLGQAPDASVVVTVETHALAPAAYWGSFAIAKQGLLALVAIAAAEWAPRASVRINALLPGPVASPQRSRTHPAEDASRLALPEEVAHGYLYLLGPQATGVTGRLLDLTPAG